jgi:hypothetical protein
VDNFKLPRRMNLLDRGCRRWGRKFRHSPSRYLQLPRPSAVGFLHIHAVSAQGADAKVFEAVTYNAVDLNSRNFG